MSVTQLTICGLDSDYARKHKNGRPNMARGPMEGKAEMGPSQAVLVWRQVERTWNSYSRISLATGSQG